MIDVSDLLAATLAAVSKGDKPGHPFRGNQHTRGGGKGGAGGSNLRTRVTPQQGTPPNRDAAEQAALDAKNTAAAKEELVASLDVATELRAKAEGASVMSDAEFKATVEAMNKPMTERQLIDNVLKQDEVIREASAKNMAVVTEILDLKKQVNLKKNQARKPEIEARLRELEVEQMKTGYDVTSQHNLTAAWAAAGVAQGLTVDGIMNVVRQDKDLVPQGWRNTLGSATNWGGGPRSGAESIARDARLAAAGAIPEGFFDRFSDG